MRTEGRGLNEGYPSVLSVLSPRTSVLLRNQDHFAALARLDQVKPGGKLLQWK